MISEEEEKLFNEWKTKHKKFVRDGVVSEEEYRKANPKIVFVLKEVNDPGEEEWDLRKFLSEGGRPQTWDNIARWVDGIQKRKSIPDWESYKNVSPDLRTKTLQSICVINLKKTPGRHTADNALLEKSANEDKEFISRQYEIYNPDLTICGGTGDLFKKVVGHDSQKKWKVTKRGIWWYENAANKYVVSFSHPQARICSSLLLYGLVDAINEILG